MDHFLKEYSINTYCLFFQAANKHSANLAGVVLILCQLLFHSQRVLSLSVQCVRICSGWVIPVRVSMRFCTSLWAYSLFLTHISAMHQKLISGLCRVPRYLFWRLLASLVGTHLFSEHILWHLGGRSHLCIPFCNLKLNLKPMEGTTARVKVNVYMDFEW